MSGQIGIGLVGYGGIGKLHALVYRALPVAFGPALPPIKLRGICTATEASAERARVETEVELATTELQALLDDPAIQVVDCCVPTALHAEVALAVLAAGKALYCQKPLAHSLAAAEEIAAASRRVGMAAGLHFNFRWAPALRHARRLIDEGFLGELYSARLTYLRSSNVDARRPMGWRFRRATGGGVLLDLGSHAVDLATYLFGPAVSVGARWRTMVTHRPGAQGDLEAVDTDDAVWLEVEFAGGGVATLEASKMAVGAQDDLRIEAYGSRGAFRFDAMDPHWLWCCATARAGRGYERLPVGDRHEPSLVAFGADVVSGWPSWHMASVAAFLRAVATGSPFSPSLDDGVAVQRVLDGARRSAESGGGRIRL